VTCANIQNPVIFYIIWVGEYPYYPPPFIELVYF